MFEEHAADLEPNLSILNIDPPDHTRLRRLVSKAFTPRTVETLRPLVQQLVDDALDAMAVKGVADLVEGLAFPLPFDVISEMLGMPDNDKEQIRDWSAAIVKTIDPVITEEEVIAATEASRHMDRLNDEVIEWKRANPADDPLTALIEAEEDGDRMTARELRDQVSVLFIAGHETTVNLIGTGIYELLRHPDQLAQLGAERLDLGRGNVGQHVSFGSGMHYCLGASLAKLEAEVAIGTFVRRFPSATVAGQPEWNGRINLRGLEKLDIDFS